MTAVVFILVKALEDNLFSRTHTIGTSLNGMVASQNNILVELLMH